MAEGEDEVRAAAGEPERPKSDEIRQDIERTRMELEETVDALGEKLSPRRMAEEGWQAVKTTSEQQANRLVRIAREHPIPLSLIGVGVTWWIIENRRRSREDWSAYQAGHEDYSDVSRAGEYTAGTGYESDAYGSARSEGYTEARSAIAGAAERVQDTASDAAHRASELASQAGVRVRQMASTAGSKVGDMAGTVKERAVDLGQRTGRQVRRAREGYWDLVERRPLAAGVATMAAGLLVGLLIPNTRRENRLMGETRDELLRGARDASQRTLEKTKEVARTAMDAAGTAAQSEAQRQKLPL